MVVCKHLWVQISVIYCHCVCGIEVVAKCIMSLLTAEDAEVFIVNLNLRMTRPN